MVCQQPMAAAAAGAMAANAHQAAASRLQQLSTAGDALSGFVAYDPSDGEAAELSRLLDDSSVPHRYFYQPYASEDTTPDPAAAPWRQQVCSAGWLDGVTRCAGCDETNKGSASDRRETTSVGRSSARLFVSLHV